MNVFECTRYRKYAPLKEDSKYVTQLLENEDPRVRRVSDVHIDFASAKLDSPRDQT